MSSHTYVYIGVYLVVDEFVAVDRTRRECERGHRHRRSSHEPLDQFCSECGSRIGTVEYVDNRRMSAYDAAEKCGFMEDTFNDVDRGDKPSIWLGNEKSDSLTDGEEYAGEFEINPDTISAAVYEFATKYAVPLGMLDDHGIEYAVHYGTVMYTH